ncbi:MAG: helix-turn-helix domain-containing protein [Acidobacteria bacterium]|jgi:molybdate-binding protein/DNA-binding XRE family transcriptional regulator|nr:MAG: helix-turn-helix domain-containing protein [Acidobacteriota bacterium]
MPNKVKYYRQRLGLSQEELSRICSIPRTTLSAIETAKASPSVEYAIRLAKALNCTVEELFTQEDKPIFFENFKDGPFLSAKVQGRTVLYPQSSNFLPPDGVLKGGKPQWFEKSPPLTYTFAGCDVSFHSLSCLLKEDGVRFLPLYASSLRAIELLKDGLVHMAGVHLGSLEENLKEIQKRLGKGFVVLKLFEWEEGIILASNVSAISFKELKKARLRWLVREKGSGARKLFEELKDELKGESYKEIGGGHEELAISIRNHFGDAGVGTRYIAIKHSLGFLSVKKEDYCICYRQELEEEKDFLKLIALLMSKRYRQVLESLPGYLPQARVEKILV